MRRASLGLLLSLLAVCGGQAAAQQGAQGNVKAPERAAVCAACHGADGNAQLANSPSLAGQPKVFLENQLIVIREGLRVIPAMTGILDKYSDQEISELAGYYAALPVKSKPAEKRQAQFDRGRDLAAKMHCASCHLPDYAGREQMPRLAGQREDYLLHSMRDFKSGKAVGRDTIMASALYGTSDQDLQDLAHYLALLK